MATYTASFAVGPKTLVASTVDTVTLEGNTSDYVEVSNYAASDDIRCTVDLSVPDAAATTDVYYIPAGLTKLIRTGNGKDIVKLISAGTPTYSVTGAP